MQVVPVTIYAILILTLFLQSSECSRVKGDATEVSCSTLGKKQSKSDVDPKYTLLTKDCFQRESCLAFLYMEKGILTDDHLIRIVNKLNDINPNKQSLVLAFFDDEQLANAHATGKREPRDIEKDARAIFRRDKEQEFLRIRELRDGRDTWRILCKSHF